MMENSRTHLSENDPSSEDEENDSENGHLIEKHLGDSQHRCMPVRFHWSLWAVTAFNVAVLVGTLMLATRFNGFGRFKELTDVDALRKTHSYSPIMNTMTPEIRDVVFNGSFVNYPPSIYRSDPSEEINVAWDEISDVGWILITKDDVVKMGKDPKISSKAPDALLKAMNKSGEELYFGQIDAFHQLHCLNEIRQHAYWDHYHKHKWGAYDDHTPHPLHWTHISHCINAIRENIMCHADMEVITSTWTAGQDWPFPDFNLRKKCSNFDQLQDWQAQNRIPKDLLDYLATPDDVELQTLAVEVYRALDEPIPEGYPFDHEPLPHKAWDSSW